MTITAGPDGALHVTNGDSAVEALRDAGFTGFFLPWRDVLHDGPVPADLSIRELAAVRAAFVADQGWLDSDHALRSSRERDRLLERLERFVEVVLWFEHDLYDQLQLIQVLDRVAESTARPARLSMTVAPEFIAMLPADRLRQLFRDRRPVTESVFAAATVAWNAYRAPDPVLIGELVDAGTDALPYLGSALHRLLEEYPAPGSGLSRTEEQILDSVAAGHATPDTAFRACLAREEAAFMGDASFWQHMNGLLTETRPLLEWREEPPAFPPVTRDDRRFADCGVAVTADGHFALAAKLDHAVVNGSVRWIGGVQQRPGNLWRYDRRERRLIAP